MDSPQISVEVTETYKSFDPLAKVTDSDLTWTFPQIDYHRGTINNFDVSFGDFSFIGCIVHCKVTDEYGHESTKSSVISFPGYEVPAEFHGVKPVCEHCELKRNRVTTFIVLDNDTGKYQQVGSTCFNVFLGCDASDIIRALRIISRISDTEGYEEKTRKTKKSVNAFNTKDILRLTNSVVRLYGYHAREEKSEFIPTADIVREICLNPQSNESKTWVKMIQENRNDYLDEAVVNAVQKWALSDIENVSWYMQSVRRIVKYEIVSEYELGTLCSAIDAHTKEVKRKIEVKKMYSGEFFGSIGESHCMGLKCVDRITVSGYNGQTYLFRLVDSDKNLFTWFHETGFDLKVGQIKKLQFKIKDHKKFRSEQQTQIFWVKEINEYDDKYTECPEYNDRDELDSVV